MPMPRKDYYDVLGVSKDADFNEIRRAYRKQALKYHPDKNRDDPETAKQLFQDVAEAFDVLSDKDKKEVYDRFGDDGLADEDECSGSYDNSADDMFQNLFNTNSNGGTSANNFGGGPPKPTENQQHTHKAPPIVHELPLSLEELYKGCTKKMKVTRQRNSIKEATVLQIDVGRGWKAGTKITFQNEGDEFPNTIPADIVFVIQEMKHRLFTRHGSNLHHEVRITLKQSLTGFSVELVGIDGQKLRIRVKPLQSSAYRKVIQGHGMPLSKRPDARGDLILNFVIEMPTKLSDLQLQQLLTNL